MRKITLMLLFPLLLATPGSASAQDWYQPMNQYGERLILKDFGILIDDQFYQGKESLFPFNRFYGYHAGVDLEVLPGESEQKVAVYSISKGKITYTGYLEGYGGVILQAVDDKNHTALYGHVKIKGLPYQVGDEVPAGKIITFLGDEFSSETSKERKHLHFAIYKGADLYFRGHESSLAHLNNRWTNPTIYLKNKGAIDPKLSAPTVTTSKSAGLFYNVIEVIKTLLSFWGFKL